MDPRELRRVLAAVRQGVLTEAEAERRLRWSASFEQPGGFATVDLHRHLRCGFPEVIFGQGKTAEQVAAILHTLVRHGQGGLATRIGPEVAEHLRREFPEGEYHALGRTFRVRGPEDPGPKLGKV